MPVLLQSPPARRPAPNPRRSPPAGPSPGLQVCRRRRPVSVQSRRSTLAVTTQSHRDGPGHCRRRAGAGAGNLAMPGVLPVKGGIQPEVGVLESFQDKLSLPVPVREIPGRSNGATPYSVGCSRLRLIVTVTDNS
jgi:hypothetical protein